MSVPVDHHGISQDLASEGSHIFSRSNRLHFRSSLSTNGGLVIDGCQLSLYRHCHPPCLTMFAPALFPAIITRSRRPPKASILSKTCILVLANIGAIILGDQGIRTQRTPSHTSSKGIGKGFSGALRIGFG